jgi:hypothetical protein
MVKSMNNHKHINIIYNIYIHILYPITSHHTHHFLLVRILFIRSPMPKIHLDHLDARRSESAGEGALSGSAFFLAPGMAKTVEVMVFSYVSMT